MLSFPVITREMLAAARSPLQYRVRAAVGALAAFYMLAMAANRTSAIGNGLELFHALHASVIALIVIVGAALTSDAISRERREGTLDLLFLTPLTATRIVSSKLFSQGLRLLTIWVATLPVTTIPLLAGGLDLVVLTLSICTQLACIVLSLLTGLTVSALIDKPFAAMLTGIPLALFAISLNSLFLVCYLGGSFTILSALFNLPYQLVWSLLFVFTAPIQLSRAVGGGSLRPANLVVDFSLDLVVVIIFATVGARLLARLILWQRQSEKSRSVAIWFRKVFLTPAIFKNALRYRLRMKINRNPLNWLEYRNPWSRSARWMVCGALIVVESYVVTYGFNPDAFASFQLYVVLAIDLLICVTASLSFQREKENGAFELLLVAPLSEERLIWGRMTAVWSYYKPVAILVCAFYMLALSFPQANSTWPDFFGVHLLSLCFSAVTIPLAGFYFALTRRHFVVILASTVFIALLLPYFAWDLVRGLGSVLETSHELFGGSLQQLLQSAGNGLFLTLLLHCWLISFFARRILCCLRDREFAL